VSAVLALVGAAEKGVGSVNERVASFLGEVENLLSLIQTTVKQIDKLPADLTEEDELMGSRKPTLAVLN
jgi:hypothetical protein